MDLVLLGLAMLTACGSVSEITGQNAQTAEQVVSQLTQRVSTSKPGVVFTAETDPNKAARLSQRLHEQGTVHRLAG